MEKVNREKNENIKERFGKAVRNRRRRCEISQEDLGDLCGLHRTYISEIERGKRNVALENIEKIAQALKTTPAGLFEEMEKGYESK